MTDSRFIADLHPDALVQRSRDMNAEAARTAIAMPNANPRLLSCPVCGGGSLKTFARPQGWNVDRCKVCDFRFTNPTPTSEQIRSFYEGPAKEAENDVFEATRGFRLKMFMLRAEMVVRHLSQGTLLEVGGATGLFAEALTGMSQNFDMTVVELSPDACARLSRRFPAIHVVNDDIYAHRGRYGGVAIWDTLAYLPDPASAMRHLASLLEPGGYLFLNTLNTHSLEHEIAGSEHPQLQPFPTINYFGLGNLRRLLETTGFEVLEAMTPNAQFDIRFALQQAGSPEIRARLGEFLALHLADTAFAEDFAALLRHHCLGGNVTLAARLRTDQP